MTEPTAGESRRRRIRPLGFGHLAGFFAVIGVIIAPLLANQLFPERTVESCIILERQHGRAHRTIVPKIASDCGSFTKLSRSVVCSADESLELRLIPGYTYDLVVRGPRIPFLSRPTVVSASVSSEQKLEIGADYSEVFDPPEGLERFVDEPNETVERMQREFEEQFGVEALRAYDYEQPPFDPECEVGRSLMTANGIQHVPTNRAELLLKPPEGVTPANPKLPCEGFHCDHRVHQRRSE